MLYNIYVIRDSKTGYLTPTFDINDASAARNFEHACMNKQSLLFTHFEDYELFCIGTYNTETARIKQSELRHIINGADVRKE